jgi:acetyl-CoA synthetase
MLTPIPGGSKLKPGSASQPFFGIKPVILDKENGKVVQPKPGKADVSGILVIADSWPGMARTVFGDHERYLNTYMRPYEGYYFTGDGCILDKDGFYWITGRVDDVLNVSGHRLGTAEIEAALVSGMSDCVEAACVAIPHDLKGQCVFAFCILNREEKETDVKALKMACRKGIGAFAQPDSVLIVPGLPKTRSGKIMRRLLRKIAEGVYDLKKLGNITTLADPSIVEKIIECRKIMK